jgi:hypothetical protein
LTPTFVVAAEAIYPTIDGPQEAKILTAKHPSWVKQHEKFREESLPACAICADSSVTGQIFLLTLSFQKAVQEP